MLNLNENEIESTIYISRKKNIYDNLQHMSR